MTEQTRSNGKSSTIKTTTTRRLWRRTDTPAAWWPWGILPIAGLAILFLFGAVVTAPDIQAEVRNNVGDQLTRAGAAVGSINADGQAVRARVSQTNFDDTTLAALGEATRCDTWVGELRCPSQVAIEQDVSEAAPAMADRRPQAKFEDGDAGGMPGTFDVRALRNETLGQQGCNDTFADLLESTSIRFRTSSAEIDAASESLLAELASVASSCPGQLTIAGHTDSRGDAAMNKALSLARAAAVRDAFAALGIETDRMRAVGFGAEQPVADNATPEGRARNRRIAISMDSTQ